MILWPDLSTYGMQLKISKSADGTPFLVMLGGDKDGAAMEALGFKKSPQYGFWYNIHYTAEKKITPINISLWQKSMPHIRPHNLTDADMYIPAAAITAADKKMSATKGRKIDRPDPRRAGSYDIAGKFLKKLGVVLNENAAPGDEKIDPLFFTGKVSVITDYDSENGGVFPLEIKMSTGAIKEITMLSNEGSAEEPNWVEEGVYQFNRMTGLTGGRAQGVAVDPVELRQHWRTIAGTLTQGEPTLEPVEDVYLRNNQELLAEQEAASLEGATEIGANFRKEKVYIKNGKRIVKLNSGDTRLESDLDTPARFLRAGSVESVDFSSLVQSIDGLLAAKAGSIITDDTISKMSDVLFEDDTLPGDREEAIATTMHGIEGVLAGRIGKWAQKKANHEILDESIRQMGNQTPDGSSILPLPVAVTMSKLLGDRYTSVVDTNAKSPIFLALAPKQALVSLTVDEHADDARSWFDHVTKDIKKRYSILYRGQSPEGGADRVIGTLNGGNIEPEATREHLLVTKADTKELIALAEQMRPDGRAVFMLDNDGSPGDVSESSRHMLNFLQDHYEDVHVLDLAPTLFSRNLSPERLSELRETNTGRRVIAIQSRREKPVVSDDLIQPVVVENYSGLWRESERVLESVSSSETKTKEAISAKFVPEMLEEADQAIAKQAPLATASNREGPQFWTPVNLQAPQRNAANSLRKWVADKHQTDVDSFVQAGLGMNDIELNNLYPVQIDAVAMAAMNDDKDRALILGDLTGVGKGRSLAAIYRYFLNAHNRPAIFITERADLLESFFEDLKETETLHMVKPYVLNDGFVVRDQNDEIADKGSNERINESLVDAVIAGGIQALKNTKGETPNLVILTGSQVQKEGSIKGKLIAELAKNAQVLIDEAHRFAGNSNSGKFMRKTLEDAQGVTFSSATFSRVGRQIGVYQRAIPQLGSQKSIAHVLDRSGESMMEGLSSMLAADGVLLRRENNMGNMVVNLAESEHKKTEREDADTFADMVSRMLDIKMNVKDLVNIVVKRVAPTQSSLAGIHIRGNLDVEDFGVFSAFDSLSKQFTIAAKTPFIIDEAKRVIANGQKPLIGFERVMASTTTRFIEKRAHKMATEAGYKEGTSEYEDAFHQAKRNTTNFDRLPSFYDLVEAQAEKLTEIRISTYQTSPKTGKKVKRKSTPLDVRSIRNLMTQNEIDMLDRINADINDMLTATRPLSNLTGDPASKIRIELEKETYNGKQVRFDEITGRSKWFVENDKGGYDLVTHDKEKRRIRDRFNGGDIDGLLINAAGATGINLHASEKFVDQRQRVSMIGQVFSDPNNMIQFLGRANRSGQVVEPEVLFMNSGICAEERQNSMLVSQMRKASACTTANRDNLHLIDTIDILNPVGDETCRRYLVSHPGVAKQLGFGIERDVTGGDEARVTNEKGNSVRNGLSNAMTGRMLLLSSDQNEEIYKELHAEYTQLVTDLDNKGENPNRVARIPGVARVIDEQVMSGVKRKEYSSVFEHPLIWTKIRYRQPINLFTPDVITDHIAHQQKRLREEAATRFLIPANADSLKEIAKRLDKEKEDLAEQSLFINESLEDQIKDKKGAGYWKLRDIKRLIETLETIDVGSIVQYRRPDMSVGQAVVTKIQLPHFISGRSNANHYTITKMDANHGETTSTLADLHHDSSFQVEATSWSKDHPIAQRMAETPSQYRDRDEWLLHGNTFEAHAYLLRNDTKAEPAAFELDDGRSGVGLRIRQAKTADELLKGPASFKYHRAVGPFLDENPYVTVRSCLAGKESSDSLDVRLSKHSNGTDYLLRIPKSKSAAALHGDTDLAQLVSGGFQPVTQKQLGGVVLAADISAVAAILIEHGYDLFTTAGKKPWVDKYAEEHEWENPLDHANEVREQILQGTYNLPVQTGKHTDVDDDIRDALRDSVLGMEPSEDSQADMPLSM